MPFFFHHLRSMLLWLCLVAPTWGQDVLNGINIKIDFTPPREVRQPDNKYFNAAKAYLDWILAHRDDAGRFPEKVFMPSMEIDGYSSANKNNKAVILACHMSYILDDPAYYRPVEKILRADLRGTDNYGFPGWGESGGGGGGGEAKQPAPRRDMYLLEPLYSEEVSLGYWIQGVGDKLTGNFNRHSGFDRTTHFFVNEGGSRYNHWIHGYQFTWIEEYLHYIDTLVDLYENHREDNGWPAADKSVGLEARTYYLKELVRALPYIPADHPLRPKIRSHIDRSIPGPISLGVIDQKGLEHKQNCINAYYDMYWHHLERGQEDLAQTYLDLLLRNADAHLGYRPEATVWPWTVGLTLRTYVCAWYATGEQRYLDQARVLGDLALEHYFDLGPLPRANIRRGINDFYRNDSYVWGDFLVLQLFELGLALDEGYGREHKILWTHIR
ncbi:MAG: hypothetical protein ACOCVS_02050 [Planctomycetota bacterium]